MNIEFISSILIYTVVYLVFIALLRLRGRGFLTTVYTYFFNRKRGASLQSEGGIPNYFFVFLSVSLSFSILSMLMAFLIDPPFVFFNALIYFLIIFGYYFLVLGLVRLFGWAFNRRHCASEIILNLRTKRDRVGIIHIPVRAGLVLRANFGDKYVIICHFRAWYHYSGFQIYKID